jgi:hypothetical protein
MSRIFITPSCSGMGFDSSRAEQIANLSQCRLLLERIDLYQDRQMLYVEEGVNADNGTV